MGRHMREQTGVGEIEANCMGSKKPRNMKNCMPGT